MGRGRKERGGKGSKGKGREREQEKGMEGERMEATINCRPK